MKQFLSVLKEFYAIKKTTFTDTTAGFWIASMQAAGYDSEKACKALQSYILDPEKSKFLPSPGDLVGQIEGTKADIEAEAAVEFSNMLAGIRKAGIYNDAVFCNHRTNMAIHVLGGWRFVCSFENWDDYIGRKMFIDAYKAVCLNPVAMSLPLTGKADFRNLYKFGRTPEEKTECNRLLEMHKEESLPNLQRISVKTLASAV